MMQRGEQHDFRQVLQHSPFHARVENHCLVKNWMSWNGYQTPRVLDTLASEYFAIRSSCSVMDLTPMEKYRISGPDAVKFLNRLVTRDISGLKPNRVTYVVWCNDEGKVLDDGTIFSLGEGVYRLCAQHHQLDWLLMSSLGMDVSIEEETHEVAALAVQGPTSCSVLSAAGITGLEQLKPFGIMHVSLEGFEVMVSRTGFTGDLGYELWTDPANALPCGTRFSRCAIAAFTTCAPSALVHWNWCALKRASSCRVMISTRRKPWYAPGTIALPLNWAWAGW